MCIILFPTLINVSFKLFFISSEQQSAKEIEEKEDWEREFELEDWDKEIIVFGEWKILLD